MYFKEKMQSDVSQEQMTLKALLWMAKSHQLLDKGAHHSQQPCPNQKTLRRQQ